MHEKTLLFGALGCTAIAAVIAVARGGSSPSLTKKPSEGELPITKVPQLDKTTLARAEVPIRLTSTDGTGLRLRALRANAVVEDPLALTELRLTFENPEARVLEGTFRITLPQGASLSRFAMNVNGAWQEGEVVEKQAARRAYEDFLHRKQDPALMEQGAGNEFSARVFPIPARGTKEIIIAYTEVVEAGAPYVLPLRGLPQLGNLDIDVHASGARAGSGGKSELGFGLHQERFTPAEDFTVEAKQVPRSGGLRSGDVAIARVVPFTTSRPEAITSAVFLFDTSASRGLGLAEQGRLLKGIVERLAPETLISVGCFDQEVVPLYEGKAHGFGERELEVIAARAALGASNVEQALTWAATTAKRTKATRVVLLGDGVATAGETDAQKLKEHVERLRGAGITRMDAVAVGGIRDDGFLRTIVRGVLDRDGVVLDAKLGTEALARRLGEATTSGVPITVEGATWSWPRTLDGLQAGDEIMVYANVTAATPVKITVGTQQFAPDLRTGDRPLVERAWAQAKIQSLVEAPTEDAANTKRAITALSTRHRVLSPHTAMLVLESDNDYRRFNIDRTADVDILSVKDGRIAIAHSPRRWERGVENRAKGNSSETKRAEALPQPAQASAAAPPPSPRRELMQDTADDAETESFGRLGAAPGLGLSGIGEGGGGNARATAEPRDVGDSARAREQAASAGDGAPGHGAAPQSPRSAPPSARAAGGPETFDPAAGLPPAPAPSPTAAASVASVVASPPSRDDVGRRPRPPVPTTPPTSTAGLVDSAARGQVRAGALVVQGGISQNEVQRVVRSTLPRLRACYTSQLTTTPSVRGSMSLSVVVDAQGEVRTVDATTSPSAELKGCVQGVFRSVTFPAPGTQDAKFTAAFDFIPSGTTSSDEPARAENGNVPRALPYEGRFKTVMDRISQGDKDGALDEAKRWQVDQPGDVMAFVALGEAYEARGDIKTAARAYGSILELFSFRADSRRFAGERLERLEDQAATKLAVDTYGKAAEQRPDHPASHRLYAFTLLKAGEHEKAFEAMRKGASRSYPPGRFAGVDRILREDLGLIAAVWSAAEPQKRDDIRSRLRAAGGIEESGPSLRFVLVWETDANDVDFHIYDGKGGHAYYGNRALPSGGELYADVTTGYGPECFTIRGPRETRAYPFTLQAHYYSRGPMGYGMGKLEVVEHDGRGHLTFDERPFVVMVDRAYVDLGRVEKTKALTATAQK